MGVMKETRLQQRIQKLIKRRGGYVNKNHGSMISEPGIADLTVCYRGIYLALEVKEGDNTPSAEQGIHARNVWKAGGICAVTWTIEEAETVLNILDDYADGNIRKGFIKLEFENANIDDGTRW